MRKEAYILFARLTIVQMKIGSYDVAKKLDQESVVPTAKSQRGYYQE